MILLDTNAYSALVLGKESVVSKLPDQGPLYLCPPVIAELRLGFKLGNKNEENEKKLQKFLATNSILDINLETTVIFAQLAAFARQCGISLSQNDLWIAAICQQNDTCLFTYDKDFEVFSELFGEKLLILNN
jgi:predicted nucleic acid-binding protein